jgi:hypothetical protein
VISDKTLVADLAVLIAMNDPFARDASKKLFRYHGGVYVDGEFFLRHQSLCRWPPLGPRIGNSMTDIIVGLSHGYSGS